jgi:hypothetical protein
MKKRSSGGIAARQSRMLPTPDHGEYIYHGSDKLEGRETIMTGAVPGLAGPVAVSTTTHLFHQIAASTRHCQSLGLTFQFKFREKMPKYAVQFLPENFDGRRLSFGHKGASPSLVRFPLLGLPSPG